MSNISEAKKLLDEINSAVSSYDAVLKEQARDILLEKAFGKATGGKSQHAAEEDHAGHGGGEEAGGEQFNTLVERWEPETQGDWALLGAYYFQKQSKLGIVTAFQVNKELKQHGHSATNITVSFNENIKAQPARMRQVKKAGKSKQARKQYVVTTVGMKYVEDRLNGVAA